MSDRRLPELARLGWNEGLARALDECFGGECAPGRVLSASHGLYVVGTEAGEATARVAGAARRRAAQARELPVVGDWVLLRRCGPSLPDRPSDAARETARPPWVIAGVLPRRSLVSRKQPGRAAAEQPLAANVDIACILLSLEGGRLCNSRTAERYLALVGTSGAQPIVVLNKADIAAARERSFAEITRVAPGVEVFCASCATGEGIDDLRARLKPGTTTLLLGPSGVGKSTLVNLLAGDPSGKGGELRPVGMLRRDLKGRHTTTSRELLLLPGGAMIIDTPGLREISPWGGDSDLDAAFPEISLLAGSCRFRDCTHSHEPGCAVQAAAASGEITPDRLAAYLELRQEITELEARAAARADRRGKGRRWQRGGVAGGDG